MKREFLKELGLEDDAINAIMAEHGKSVNEAKEKAEKVDTLEAQLIDYKTQIASRDEQLNALSEKANGNTELLAQIDELKAANTQTAADYEAKITQQAFDHKLENALIGANTRNAKAVKALLDFDKIELDGDQLKGLDEQLEALKESEEYLFQTAPAAPQIQNPGEPTGGTDGDSDAFTAIMARY